MLEITESPGHVVAMKISGELTGADVQRAYDALENALKSHDRVSFYAEVEQSFEMTLDALIKDLMNGLGQLGTLNRYYRAAVVTDKQWLATLARVEGLVFAWMQIRVFPTSERMAAFEWASEPPPPKPEPAAPPPAIKFIPTTQPNVIAYEVNGRVNEKDIDEAVKVMNEAYKTNDKVRVFGLLSNLKGFDVRAVARRDLFDLKSTALRKVERYAIVGAPTWLGNFLELIRPMFNTEIRVFDGSEEKEAWEWLGAQPA